MCLCADVGIAMGHEVIDIGRKILPALCHGPDSLIPALDKQFSGFGDMCNEAHAF